MIGKLFIFEGPDGIGKTTLARKAATHIRSKQCPCAFLSFPGKSTGTLGDLVYKLHHNPGQYGIPRPNATSLQTLHIAAHIELIARRINPLLARGTHIVLDRFWWSTLVYGAAFGANRKVLEMLVRAEKQFWDDIVPSCAFLIVGDKPFRKEMEPGLWNAISTGYRQIAAKEARQHQVAIVANRKSLAEATAIIAERIDTILQD